MIIDPSLFRLPFTSAVKMQKKLKVAIIIGAGEENELVLGPTMCGIKATSCGTKLTPKCFTVVRRKNLLRSSLP